MQKIDEIIAAATSTTYTSPSEPVLDICRELSSSGRFGEIAEVLVAWCKHAPHSENFIKARLPAIILNAHLVKQDILTFEQFINWEMSAPKWACSIKDNALSATGLPAAVASVIEAMRQFSNHAQPGSQPHAAR